MFLNLKSVCNLFCYSSTTLAIIDNNPKTKKQTPALRPMCKERRKKRMEKKKKTACKQAERYSNSHMLPNEFRASNVPFKFAHSWLLPF